MFERDVYRDGYRDGLRFAVRWLHMRALTMNDPKAVNLLNSAATNLGHSTAKTLDWVDNHREDAQTEEHKA